MEKLNLHSPDFTQENIAKLAELFPNCVTETRESDGTLNKGHRLRSTASRAVYVGR